MKKQIGDDNKKARAAAVATLSQLKGASVDSLKDKEMRALLAALLQLLGLVDEEGKIKQP